MTVEYLKIEEVAERLGIHAVTVRRWAREGKLPGIKIGGIRLIHKASFEKMLYQDGL